MGRKTAGGSSDTEQYLLREFGGLDEGLDEEADELGHVRQTAREGEVGARGERVRHED